MHKSFSKPPDKSEKMKEAAKMSDLNSFFTEKCNEEILVQESRRQGIRA